MDTASWWADRQKALAESEHLQEQCAIRGADPNVVKDAKLGLVTEADWIVLVEQFPGLTKWLKVLEMPALAVIVDGEFGWEGILLREIKKRVYVTARHASSKGGPFSLGLTHCLQEIWKDGWVIVVEGLWDWVAIRHYTKNVVAVLTDNISPALVNTLGRYVKVVGLMMDNDPEGQKGQAKSKVRVERQEMSPYLVRYAGKDPSDAYQKARKTTDEAMKKAITDIEWLTTM